MSTSSTTANVDPVNADKAWATTVNKVSNAIAALRMTYVRGFDGSSATCAVATGFIVNKEKGLILTNRHVVSAGPVVAQATFLNKEEVSLTAVYRDPVHDFGFFRFDPSKVQFAQLDEIDLRPEEAKVGVEVRVIGNDAGEKLSILSGTLARLDREAPEYSRGYQDFNTFYVSAASSTSGGSSGSPVVNIHGNAVALNAGGSKGAASSYYFPLDRVVHALRLIERGQLLVPRGTLQTIFKYKAFDDVRRLGLPQEQEKEQRALYPTGTGMLVVHQVLPQGPGAEAGLSSGDILIKVDSNPIGNFVNVESLLDDKAEEAGANDDGNTDGQNMPTVLVEIQRGDERLTLNVNVQSLSSLEATQFMELSGAVLHRLSYQQAKRHNLAVQGVYVSTRGHMFQSQVGSNTVLLAVGSQETPTLEAFEQAVSILPNRHETTVRFVHISSPHRERVGRIRIDRRWHTMRIATLDRATSEWNYRLCAEPETKQAELVPRTARFHPVPGLPAHVVGALVTVVFNMPQRLDAVVSTGYRGTGVVVDRALGLVICDRDTVPCTLGDVDLIIASVVEIPANVLFVHPLHNYAVLQYDPKLLGDTEMGELSLSPVELEVGAACTFVGVTRSLLVSKQTCHVVSVERIHLGNSLPPRFTARNQDVVRIDRKITNCEGGVLLDSEHRVQAFWMSFYSQSGGEDRVAWLAMKAKSVYDTVEHIKLTGANPVVRSLGVDATNVVMSQARSHMGLTDEWVEKLEHGNYSDTSRKVLVVDSMLAGLSPAEVLHNGDVLLAINDEPIMTNQGLEELPQNADDPTVSLSVLRAGTETKLQVPTAELTTCGTQRFVCFAGLTLQPTYPSVRFHGFMPQGVTTGVYCSQWCHGSPAQTYQCRARVWIVQVNGVDVPDLDAFLEQVSKCADQTFLRLKVVNLHAQTMMWTLCTDFKYWPTVELRRVESEWVLRTVTHISTDK